MRQKIVLEWVVSVVVGAEVVVVEVKFEAPVAADRWLLRLRGHMRFRRVERLVLEKMIPV